MKYLIAMLAILAVPDVPRAHENTYQAVLERVIDGDTFVAHMHLGDELVLFSQKMRMTNIDAPELRGKCPAEVEKAHLAKNRLEELLSDGFLVRVTGRSKFGERLVVVLTPDGIVNEMLVEEHLARTYAGGARAGWCS